LALSPEEAENSRTHPQRRGSFLCFCASTAMSSSCRFSEDAGQSYSPEPGGASRWRGLLALATLLQAYGHVGDRDAVEADRDGQTAGSWCWAVSCRAAPLQSGDLFNSGMRLIARLDKTLLDRTVTLGRKTGGSGPDNCVRFLDSTRCSGRRRVEDTLDLLGHALRKAVGLCGPRTGDSAEAVVESAGSHAGGHSSLKAALDLIGGSPGRVPPPWAWPGGGGPVATLAGTGRPWQPRNLLAKKSWRR